MNVLLTSAGRRTYMVDYFRKALNHEGLVFAVNSELSPALMQADGYALCPLIYDEDYIPFLLRYCKAHTIGLLISLFDIDLPVLARHRAAFEEIGVKLAVSGEEALSICNDKYKMFERLSSAGIRTPFCCLSVDKALSALSDGSLSFPLYIKPRFGMGSLSVYTADCKETLAPLYACCARGIQSSYLRYEAAAVQGQSVLLQEHIAGTEYGLDVVNDFSGNFVTSILRKKCAMRAGETDEAIVLGEDAWEYPILTALAKSLSALLRHVGNLDVDVIMNGEKRLPYVIDMNARFGGGYPFSQAAGADLPRAYLYWAHGEKAPESCFQVKPGVHAYKEIVMRTYKDRAESGSSTVHGTEGSGSGDAALRTSGMASGEKSRRVLLIIPAYNEAENICRVADELIRFYPQFDYVIVTDGSTDGTDRICAEAGYHTIRLPVNLGLAGCFQAGMKYAYREGYAYAVQFDGDGQHRPEYIAAMQKKMDEGYDLVLGSRFLPDAPNTESAVSDAPGEDSAASDADGRRSENRMSGMRSMGSRLIRTAIHLTTGKTVTDPTCGLRMYNRAMIDLFANRLNYAPEPDTVSYLLKNGVRFAEVPIRVSERMGGESYLKPFNAARYMLRMLTSILLIQNFREKRQE